MAVRRGIAGGHRTVGVPAGALRRHRAIVEGAGRERARGRRQESAREEQGSGVHQTSFSVRIESDGTNPKPRSRLHGQDPFLPSPRISAGFRFPC